MSKSKLDLWLGELRDAKSGQQWRKAQQGFQELKQYVGKIRPVTAGHECARSLREDVICLYELLDAIETKLGSICFRLEPQKEKVRFVENICGTAHKDSKTKGKAKPRPQLATVRRLKAGGVAIAGRPGRGRKDLATK